MRCSICKRLFMSDLAFRLHRTGEFVDGTFSETSKARRCLGLSAMVEAGLWRDSKRRWHSPKGAVPEDEKEVA